MSHLEEYFGQECPFCQKMQVISRKVEAETGIPIDRYEVWHNEENMARVEKLDADGACGGVPFYINHKTGKTICGEASEEDLRAWALGE